MTNSIQNIIIHITDFIEKIASRLSSANLKKSDYYFVPAKLIAEELNDNIEQILEIIQKEDLGLEYISEISNIKEIETLYTTEDNEREKKNLFEINTALDVLEHPEIIGSQDQVLPQLNQRKLRIDKQDFLKGIIVIKDITKFAEIAVEYVGIDKIIKIFDWKNFEDFIAMILKNFGFKVLTNFRFSLKANAKKSAKVISKTTQKEQKRFEIDVVGIRGEDILFIDAKHWSRKIDIGSGLDNAAKFQIERIKAFINDLDAINSLFEQFGSVFKRELVKKVKKVKNKQLGSKKTNPFSIYPIIIHSGKTDKKLNSQGVPLISLSEFSDVFQDFTKNKSLFTAYKLKNFQIQSELI